MAICNKFQKPHWQSLQGIQGGTATASRTEEKHQPEWMLLSKPVASSSTFFHMSAAFTLKSMCCGPAIVKSD